MTGPGLKVALRDFLQAIADSAVAPRPDYAAGDFDTIDGQFTRLQRDRAIRIQVNAQWLLTGGKLDPASLAIATQTIRELLAEPLPYPVGGAK